MEETIDSVIRSIHNEFATTVVDHRLTFIELAKISELDSNSIRDMFNSLDDLYTVLFEEVMFKNIIRDCSTFEDLINHFFDFVSTNKSFCLNLYYQTLQTLRYETVIELMNDLLLRYLNGCTAIVRVNLITMYIGVLQEWFQEELTSECEGIRKRVLDYHRKTFE